MWIVAEKELQATASTATVHVARADSTSLYHASPEKDPTHIFLKQLSQFCAIEGLNIGHSELWVSC